VKKENKSLEIPLAAYMVSQKEHLFILSIGYKGFSIAKLNNLELGKVRGKTLTKEKISNSSFDLQEGYGRTRYKYYDEEEEEEEKSEEIGVVARKHVSILCISLSLQSFLCL